MDAGVSMVMALDNNSMDLQDGVQDSLQDVSTIAMMPDEGGSSIPTDRIPFVVFGCVGIIGNLIVILTLGSKYELRRKIINMFVINQSIVDMLASLTLMLFAITLPSDRKSIGISGEFYCKLWVSAVLLWSLYVTSTYNILGMTVERYLKIVHPFWYKRFYHKRHAIIGIALAWGFSFAFNFALTVPTTVIDEDYNCLSMGKWPSITHARAAGIITVIVELFIPLIILILCYGGIVVMLRRNMDTTTSDNMAASGASQQRDKTINAAYRNTIKTLALVAIVYVICWTGNQVYFLMYNLGYNLCWCGPVYIIETNLVNANSCLNPFIYAFTYNDFKKRFREIIGLKQQDSGGSVSGTTKVTSVSQSVEMSTSNNKASE